MSLLLDYLLVQKTCALVASLSLARAPFRSLSLALFPRALSLSLSLSLWQWHAGLATYFSLARGALALAHAAAPS